MLSKNNFSKAKPITFSSIIDGIFQCVEGAMDDAKMSEDHFAKLDGLNVINSETDETLCTLSNIDLNGCKVVLMCSDGDVIIPLDTIN